MAGVDMPAIMWHASYDVKHIVLAGKPSGAGAQRTWRGGGAHRSRPRGARPVAAPLHGGNEPFPRLRAFRSPLRVPFPTLRAAFPGLHAIRRREKMLRAPSREARRGGNEPFPRLRAVRAPLRVPFPGDREARRALRAVRRGGNAPRARGNAFRTTLHVMYIRARETKTPGNASRALGDGPRRGAMLTRFVSKVKKSRGNNSVSPCQTVC